MAGAMVETRVGLLAMAHVVAALGGVDWVDLDTAFLLADDPFDGGWTSTARASTSPASPASASPSAPRPKARRATLGGRCCGSWLPSLSYGCWRRRAGSTC